MPFTSPPYHLMGYVPDWPTRPAVRAQFGRLFDVAPHLSYGAPTDVFLYKAWKEVNGSYPSYVAQKIGDCTSFGSGHTTDLLECIQIALGKKPESYKEICTEAIYGMGREIANMLGSGDGCYGAAVAKAVMQGVVPRELVGPYSGERAKQWGGRSGVPAEIKTKATEHPIKATAAVTTTAEADAALGNGYPFIVCSDQGFTMHRDQDGACQASGSWAHCMHCEAARTRNGQRQYLIGQSWGPNVPDGPTTDDQPDFTFWISASSLARMLSQNDSFAFSGLAGFPGQPLPSHWTYSDFI
jgi:hypothetical protein